MTEASRKYKITREHDGINVDVCAKPVNLDGYERKALERMFEVHPQ